MLFTINLASEEQSLYPDDQRIFLYFAARTLTGILFVSNVAELIPMNFERGAGGNRKFHTSELAGIYAIVLYSVSRAKHFNVFQPRDRT